MRKNLSMHWEHGEYSFIQVQPALVMKSGGILFTQLKHRRSHSLDSAMR